MAGARGKPNGPRTIKASELKATCLKLIDEVADNSEEIVITKNGKPVSKLVPYKEQPGSFLTDDSERFPFLREMSQALDRGKGADVVWEAERGLTDGKPC